MKIHIPLRIFEKIDIGRLTSKTWKRLALVNVSFTLSPCKSWQAITRIEPWSSRLIWVGYTGSVILTLADNQGHGDISIRWGLASICCFEEKLSRGVIGGFPCQDTVDDWRIGWTSLHKWKGNRHSFWVCNINGQFKGFSRYREIVRGWRKLGWQVN